MRFLITAGPTREYIDPVRFISNASSGKMGYSLVRAAVKAGHKATLITGVKNLNVPKEIKTIYVQTTGEMFHAVKKNFNNCDCLIMAAAVCDYTPIAKADRKIKKNNTVLTIKLKPTRDILKWAAGHKRTESKKIHGEIKKAQVVVGFALEDKNLLKNAETKLKQKSLDMIVANKIDAIASTKTSVCLKTACGKWVKLNNKTKCAIAKKIIQKAENLYTACN